MRIMIVRTCDTSKGPVVCEVPGGTEDQGPIELDQLEAENLIAAGHARLMPPAPAADWQPEPALPATPASDPELVTTET